MPAFQLKDSITMSQTTMSRELLGKHISPETNRYKHILGVVNRLQDLLPKLPISNQQRIELLNAAFLHDIGYSDQLNKLSFHPLDGAIYAQRIGYAKPVVSAVLFHSCAYDQMKMYRNDLSEYMERNYLDLTDEDLFFIKVITYCDLHTSPTGENITLDYRISEVVDRYGVDHDVSKFMLACEPKFRKIVDKINLLTK